MEKLLNTHQVKKKSLTGPNVLTQRNVDTVDVHCRNYHCCPYRRCIFLQKYLYIGILLYTFCIGSLEQDEYNRLLSVFVT